MTTYKRFGGRHLQRIDLGFWYKMGETIHPLTEMSGAFKLSQIYLKLYFAKNEIEQLMPLMFASRANALALIEVLEPHVASTDINVTLEAWQVAAISQSATLFETAFKAELGIQPCYNVSPKGGYNVDVLTLAPHNLFPSDMQDFVPFTEIDIVEVGKCLAFEVPTAAAFHLHRINEAVLHVYWDVFTKKTPRPNQPSMGVYLAKLKRRKKKEAKLLAVLTQIKDLHRNPAIHPETHLTVDEAIELYGIIRSSVSRMLVTIRKG